MTQRWCAQQVDMDENSLSRALKKPHVAAFYEQQKLTALQDLKALRKQGEIAAINTALDLMQNAQSESVKARMVEFFAGATSKGVAVTVNNNNNIASTGYEMARPGQRIVDITPNTPAIEDDAAPE